MVERDGGAGRGLMKQFLLLLAVTIAVSKDGVTLSSNIVGDRRQCSSEYIYYRERDGIEGSRGQDNCETGFSGETMRVPWRPSIHMPRWASRIMLVVSGVRVERLQDISKADCIAEGVENLEDVHAGWHQYFAARWDSIYDARGFGWDKNPWVWVVEFTRVQ